jgi:hypothetical protein
MKTSQKIELKIEKEDREYFFVMPHGAPLGEAYQCAVEVVADLSRMINEYVEKLPKAEKQESEQLEE